MRKYVMQQKVNKTIWPSSQCQLYYLTTNTYLIHQCTSPLTNLLSCVTLRQISRIPEVMNKNDLNKATQNSLILLKRTTLPLWNLTQITLCRLRNTTTWAEGESPTVGAVNGDRSRRQKCWESRRLTEIKHFLFLSNQCFMSFVGFQL